MITLVNQNKPPLPCCVFFDLERAAVRAQNMIRSQQIFKKKTHSENNMEILCDFVEKVYNNNDKPWKSSRILREAKNLEIYESFDF